LVAALAQHNIAPHTLYDILNQYADTLAEDAEVKKETNDDDDDAGVADNAEDGERTANTAALERIDRVRSLAGTNALSVPRTVIVTHVRVRSCVRSEERAEERECGTAQ
jgi:hypothetical protein